MERKHIQNFRVLRNHLAYVPEWNHSFEGWSTNYITKNLWRIESYMDADDLMQDAKMYFHICKRRYPYVDNPRHFMSLFKRCLSNHIHDLSISSTRNSDTIQYLTASLGEETVDGLFEILIVKAPADIKAVLIALLENGEDYIKFVSEDFPQNLRCKRESTNEHLCRIANLNPHEINVVDRIKSYFQTVEV